MTKKILLLLAQLVIVLPLVAQNRNADKITDANLVGHVLDARTKEHLPGMTVTIKGTTIGAVTDKTGHYFLKHLTPGTYIVEMQGVGYRRQAKEVELKVGITAELNFEAEEDQIQLDQVVVTANRQSTLRRMAPTLVSVMSQDALRAVNANNLAQGLTFQPGLRVENNCQNCGFTQVRINGLDGRYTQTLIDSRPIFSALAGIYGIEQIPTSMIDRVEVVRGGGSALYGSSAIGGVVNIITKEPSANSFCFHENLTLTGFRKPDNNVGFNGSIVSDNNRIGASVFAQARQRSPWDMDGDGYSEIGKTQSKAFGTKAFFKITDYNKITAELHTIHEYRRGGDHLEWPDYIAGISERITHNIYSGNIKLDSYSADFKHHLQTYFSAQMVDRDSYYGAIQDRADELGSTLGVVGSPVPPELYGMNYGKTDNNTCMGGLQYSYDMDRLFFMPARLLIGVEYLYDYLLDRMPLRQFGAVLDDSGKPVLVDNKPISAFPAMQQTIHNWSQMAQLEWKNEQLSILLGTRIDEHSLVRTAKNNIKPILSPRAILRYNPTKNVNLRLSYAKGFRAPQTFDEDLHVGVANGEAQKVYNQQGLKPETSHSVNLSADLYGRWDGVQANFLVEGFYNKLTNVFANEMRKIENGIKYFERINGDGANIFGANLEGKLAWSIMELQGGFTFVSNQYTQPQEWGVNTKLDDKGMPIFIKDSNGEVTVEDEAMESKQMLRTPSTYGYVTLKLRPIKDFQIDLTGSYTGQMYVNHAIMLGQTANAFSKAKTMDEINNAFVAAGGKDGEAPEIHIDRLVKTPRFFDLGAKLSYTFRCFHSSGVELYAGVSNLLNSMQKDYDQGPDRDSGYIYGPLMPRSLYTGIRISF